ncbi:DUF4856 domain-containing protein [bacterium]|nr:DUF4856 domain-containing protein [bacterium]
MIKLRTYALFFVISAAFLLQSCSEDPIEPDNYDIPETYNFENVSYDGQIQRLSQFLELKALMKTGAAGTELDKTRLNAMYANDAANAMWSGTYDESKQMKNKTFESVQQTFVALLNNLAEASKSDSAAAEGRAGVASTLDQANSYLLDANGVELAQLFEKGLMGALMYYQICEVYTGDAKMNVDNTTVEPGEGTAMEHHWDEAFGYFGVPKDFPMNTDNTAFWGSYSKSRNELLGSNQKIMDAFLKGRAAISNGDLETRDVAITELEEELELVAAGSAIHYLNAAISGYDDFARRAHVLSEAAGFIYSLQFNSAGQVSKSDVESFLTLIGGNSDVLLLNFYNVSKADLMDARDQLASKAGLESIKEQL